MRQPFLETSTPNQPTEVLEEGPYTPFCRGGGGGGTGGKIGENMGVPGSCPRKSLNFFLNLQLKGGGVGEDPSYPLCTTLLISPPLTLVYLYTHPILAHTLDTLPGKSSFCADNRLMPPGEKVDATSAIIY